FAMVLPVLMALVAGALNYGVMGLQMPTLISAARGGAEYAKGNPADASLTTNTTTVTGVATTTASLTCRCSDGTTATAANCAIGTCIWSRLTMAVQQGGRKAMVSYRTPTVQGRSCGDAWTCQV